MRSRVKKDMVICFRTTAKTAEALALEAIKRDWTISKTAEWVVSAWADLQKEVDE